MEDLLFLAHRIPYPPNKGDKIRSWHVLKHLAERYRVHLACFIDDEEDRQHTSMLRDICESCYFATLSPVRGWSRSVAGLLSGKPLSLAYYSDPGFSDWVQGVCASHHMAAGYVFSSQVADYARQVPGLAPRAIMDFVDVDSDKWAQYALTKSWPLRWLYAREAKTLAAFERDVAAVFRASLFVSPHEAALFSANAPQCADRVKAMLNGVDADYFSPDRIYQRPFEADEQAIVFTGAMDYWPNVDAVTWFVEEALPLVLARVPGARFYVVGGKPSASVRRLESNPAVCVTGSVPDVRPYLAHASAVVAPLRIARGIQNKVLEGMAMARPVIATPEAAEGLDSVDRDELCVAPSADEFADSVVAALTGALSAPNGGAARRRVVGTYSWESALATLDNLLQGDIPRAAAG